MKLPALCSRPLRLALTAFTIWFSVSQLIAQPARAESAKTKPSKSSARKTLSQILTGTAKADFEAGKLLASDRDFAGALIKFSNAYEASKDPRLLWNLAFCHKNLRHYAKVLSILRRYLDEGGAALTANDRVEAQNLIAMIEPFTTRVVVQVTPDGASITVDDEPVGASPLASPVILDIGERRIRVSKEGFRPFEKVLAIGGTSEITFQAALDKDVHEGRLLVNAPLNAHILLDGQEVALGKLDLAVPSGGHQLRVVAPSMRPYQSEIVVTDKETRSVDVVLEAAAPPAKPRMRVAVGCGDTVPRGSDDGLTVKLDGIYVLQPALVKKRHDHRSGAEAVEYVEYEVPPGRHTISTAVPGCRPAEQDVDIAPDGGTKIGGALRSDSSVLFRGPLGRPGWYRLALGLWLPAAAMKKYSSKEASLPEDYSAKLGSLAGVSLEIGWVTRWFAMFLSGAWAKGTFNRDGHLTSYALPESATTSWKQFFSWRVGPRFPFNVAALGFGGYYSMHEIDLERVLTGHLSATAGAFVELDAQPFCDWGLFAVGNLGHSVIVHSSFVDGGLTVGVMYQPSARCRAERSTRYGLFTSP
jgi:hypothetical protein